jgi:hypothetical protein
MDIIVNAVFIQDNIICNVPFNEAGAPRGSCVKIRTNKPKTPIIISIYC